MSFLKLLIPRRIKLSDGVEYEKLRLGKHFQLEQLGEELTKAKKITELKRVIVAIHEIQTGVALRGDERALDILNDIFTILQGNQFSPLPVFLKAPPKPKEEIPGVGPKGKKKRWDYDGRYLAEWVNNFAKQYGWSIDEILELDVDIAAHLMQEILVDVQEEREWTYGLTELAYKYDKGSGKSTFVPLNRPYWMDDAVDKKIEKTKLLKSMLPYGVVGFGNVEIVSADEKPMETEAKSNIPASGRD